MHIHLGNSVCICIVSRRTKKVLDPNRQSNRKSAILTHFYAWYCDDLTVSQSHPQTLKMKSYQKLSPPSHLLAVLLRSILMLRHDAGSPSNLNIQFHIYSKVLAHVEGVALNTSLHQYCVFSIAPPSGHRKSDKHHLIYMTFTACFLHIIHYMMTCKVQASAPVSGTAARRECSEGPFIAACSFHVIYLLVKSPG